jgi:hypothetical protein
MKTIFFSTVKSELKQMSTTQPTTRNSSPILYSLILASVFFFAACKQEKTFEAKEEGPAQANQIKTDVELLNYYTGLDFQTLQELQQARAATARYRDINNAFRDNYKDIGLVMPNMGYHFMKTEFVDAVFDPKKPELLVYNKKEDGSFELGAVEYAVPIDPNSPNTPPDGFTGINDEWDFNTLNTGLWTLHAWVWKNNPDGVFKMTNPLVQVR